MWTQKAIHDLIQTKFKDYQLIVVANREPYIHQRSKNQIECFFPASGMATALDPIMRACGGTWIGHGSGNADRAVVDHRDRVRVPPSDPKYTLRRVWLTKEQEEGYYYGLSNQSLWPLCHIAFTKPEFHQRHWESYKEVNALFARAVLDEVEDKPTFVFVQDYHFALLPRMLKEANPNIVVAQFWHIPWPNRETLRVFPWRTELLDGLLGNDLLGFHLRYHCQNFLDTVDRALEAKVDLERSEITRQGSTTLIRPFPISIDFENHVAMAQDASIDALMRQWRSLLNLRDEQIGIGIDRLDYTKGIPNRLEAVDRFLEKNPEHRGRFVFVQVGVPSRSEIPQYKQLEEQIEQLVGQINSRWGTASWRPIHFLKQHFGQPSLAALHRLARFCLVSSLHDGMNLVAKEYVASRVDNDGMLILSEFTGAARELKDAILVNPFDTEGMADAIYLALVMSAPERNRRMRRMREEVANNNVFRWAGKILSALSKYEFPEVLNGKAVLA